MVALTIAMGFAAYRQSRSADLGRPGSGMDEKTPTHLSGPEQLSLVARLGVALCCFEGYCREAALRSGSIRGFVEYMWEWPLRMSPGLFEEWEAKRTSLVEMGLGDDAPPDVAVELQERRIDPGEFRELVEGIVEIIWGSFYAAPDNEGSQGELARVISICRRRGVRPPPLTVFAASRFADDHGWGRTITSEERDYWRRSTA
jgi:hypothetical protein